MSSSAEPAAHSTQGLTEFRHSVVQHLTANTPETHPDEPRAEQLFPAGTLTPLYANLDCLGEYGWYQGYAEAYLPAAIL